MADVVGYLANLLNTQAQTNLMNAQAQDQQQLAQERSLTVQQMRLNQQDDAIRRQALSEVIQGQNPAITQTKSGTPVVGDPYVSGLGQQYAREQQEATQFRALAAAVAKDGRASPEFVAQLSKQADAADKVALATEKEMREAQRSLAQDIGSGAGAVLAAHQDGTGPDQNLIDFYKRVTAINPALLSDIDKDQSGTPMFGQKTVNALKALQFQGMSADKQIDVSTRVKNELRQEAAEARQMEKEKRDANDQDGVVAQRRANIALTKARTKQIETGGTGAEGMGAPGGVGSELMQDTNTGQRYVINKRSGRAWEFDDEQGKYKEIPVSNVPKTVGPVGKVGTMGAREAVFTQRQILAANEATRDLENVVKLPISVSTGLLGGRKQGPDLLSATKEDLANAMTTTEVQLYNTMATGFQRSLATIEAAGLMPSGYLTHQMDQVMLREGDSNLTKLSKLAQIRQIIEAGMEVVNSNPRVSDKEKEQVGKILTSIQKAVPYKQSDVIRLMSDDDPKETLTDIMPKAGKDSSGLPEGWTVKVR